MTVNDILQALPEDMRGDAEETLKGMSNPLEGLHGAEDAAQFIKSNDVLRRGLDSEISRAVDSHKKRFDDEKLPELKKSMRDELLKELNPTETPEQKRLRELEDQLKERDNRERLYQTKEKLRAKAKEVGFDEELAERFALMNTEDPESELMTFAEKVQAQAQKLAEAEIAQRWPSKAPKRNADGATSKINSVDEVPSEWTPAQYADALDKGLIQFQGE